MTYTNHPKFTGRNVPIAEIAAFQLAEKPPAPMRVVSRWCRCVVQRLCATDCKHPCLVRAAAPHSAPARMPGVYAQGLCTMQSQPSIHSLSPRGRGLGLGFENKLHF